MLIIGDSSAVSVLAETGLLSLLPKLVITESVARECSHSGAPEELRQWIRQVPDWLRIIPDPAAFLPETTGLGMGEASSISLAWENRQNSQLILDERRGRRVAAALGLPMTGVLSIFGRAAAEGLVDFEEVLLNLTAVDFHFSPAVVAEVKRHWRL